MGRGDIIVTKNIYLYNWSLFAVQQKQHYIVNQLYVNKIFWKWKSLKIKNKKEEILVFLAPHLADIGD